MILRDWRDLAAEEVAPLYERERSRWTSTLCWDPAASLEIVESGRLRGYVPGFVASSDKGEPLGWTYFILHQGLLQIGGLCAGRPSVARALLDAIMESPEAQLARTLTCFILPDCAGVGSALARQRFVLSDTRYLEAGTHGMQTSHDRSPGLRRWREWDLPLVARLLGASYPNTPGAQPFAPDGRPEQWAQYTAQLVGTPACGQFDPALSFVAAGDGSLQVHGAVLTTRVGPDTAHIAQIAVSPTARRQGLGEGLLRTALAAAADAGLSRATLMVDSANTPANALYERLGFRESARFIYGRRPARTRIAA